MDQSILQSKYPMLSLVMYVSSTRSKLENDPTVNNESLIDARTNFEVWRGDCVHVPQEYYAVYRPSNKIGTCRICKVNDGNKSGIFYKYLHGPHSHHNFFLKIIIISSSILRHALQQIFYNEPSSIDCKKQFFFFGYKQH